jgi:hypothetical protein
MPMIELTTGSIAVRLGVATPPRLHAATAVVVATLILMSFTMVFAGMRA